MDYTKEQIQAVSKMASLIGDPWLIGEEAVRLKQEHGLSDRDVGDILESEYGRAPSRSTIQAARETFEVFGAERIEGFCYSHHVVAGVAARGDVGLRGRHDLTDDELRRVREAATAILVGIETEPGQRVTVAMVGEAVGVGEEPTVRREQAVDRQPVAPVAHHDGSRLTAGPALNSPRPRGSTTSRRPPSDRTKPKTKVSGVEVVERVHQALVTADDAEKRVILLALVDVLRDALTGLDPEVAERIQERLRVPEAAR